MREASAEWTVEQLWQAAGRGFEQLFQAAAGHDVVHGAGGVLAVTGVACPDLNCGVVWSATDATATAKTLAAELRSRGLPGILLVSDVAVELVADGHEPVGSLQVTAHDGLVGIWSMATDPARRRRGVARSGLASVLEGRFADGATLGFLIATEGGRPLYDALGFQVVDWSTAWVVLAGGAGSEASHDKQKDIASRAPARDVRIEP